MKQNPLILIIGAAGEGGSVARHLLASGQFAVRCLVPDTEGREAKALQNAGAGLVAGDLNQKESILNALHGCAGLYGVTSFQDHFIEEHQQGINLVDAVVESGVSQFVFSSQPSVHAASQGLLSVPQFEIKARLEAYARSRKADTTFVHPAFYYENFFSLFPPRKGADGSYFFTLPQGDAPLAAISVNDMGGILLPVFQNPEAFKGRVIEAVGDVLTGQEFAAVMSKVTGRKIHYQHIPRKTFVRYAAPVTEELANLFEYYRQFTPYGMQALNESRRLFPLVKSFAQKLSEEKEALLSVL